MSRSKKTTAKNPSSDTGRFRAGFIILSLGYILLGVARIVNQDTESLLICYLLGGVALVGGIIRVTFYFVRSNVSHIFRNDLAIGALLLFAGIYCILKPETILILLPVVLGFSILFDSVLKMEYSFDMRRTAVRGWGVLMVLALVSALCGVLLVLGSFSGTVLYYFLGGALIYDGLLNLLTLSMLLMALHRLKKNPYAGDGGSNSSIGALLGGSKNTAEDVPPLATPLAPNIVEPILGPSSPTIEEEPTQGKN